MFINSLVGNYISIMESIDYVVNRFSEKKVNWLFSLKHVKVTKLQVFCTLHLLLSNSQ